MNQLKMHSLFIAFIFLFISSSVIAEGKHALLIGIQDYSLSSFSSLKGPLNDIELTEGVLRERFGFVDEDFIILKNKRATHTGIEKAFKKLIKRVKPNDFVYIYYSGHGSRTPDLNGDETDDGKDETWVSYGARANQEGSAPKGSQENQHIDNYGVLDDEINVWLNAIYQKTHQVVFVSDSCHSATVGRGEISPGSRAVKDDDRQHPRANMPYRSLEKHYGIRVGAARDHQSAYEDEFFDNDKTYGVFTWYWIKALEQARKGETWNDVFKRASAQVTAWRHQVQVPQMEGERSRKVLGEGFNPRAPTVTVISASDKEVHIQAGHTVGVTRGSVYQLYRPHATDSETEDLPRLTITRVKAFESYGQPTKRFKSGDLVEEISHAHHYARVKVYLAVDYPDGQDKPLLQAIKKAFQPRSDGTQPLPAYTLTEDSSEADLRLHLLRPQRQNGQFIPSRKDSLPKSFENKPPLLWVLTPEQRLLHEKLQISFSDPTKGIKLLQKNLNKLARVREIETLESYSSFPVEVKAYLLHKHSVDNECPKKMKCEDLPNNLGRYYKTGPYLLSKVKKLKEGNIITFTLRNTSHRGYYCYLINIAPDGAVYVLFPAPYERTEYAFLPAGQTLNLLEEAGLMGELTGKEIIKFITSRQPIDVSLLEAKGFVGHGGAKGNYNPLEQLLVNAMYGLRKRVSLRNDDWSTEQIAIEVE